jgi:CBS domain-containing protein
MLMAPDEARVAGQEHAVSCSRAPRMAHTQREEGTHGKREVPVTALMITDVVTTRPNIPLEVAIRHMLAQRHKILPVVDDTGRLIGAVDRFDLLQAMARLAAQPP